MVTAYVTSVFPVKSHDEPAIRSTISKKTQIAAISFEYFAYKKTQILHQRIEKSHLRYTNSVCPPFLKAWKILCCLSALLWDLMVWMIYIVNLNNIEIFIPFFLYFHYFIRTHAHTHIYCLLLLSFILVNYFSLHVFSSTYLFYV